MGEQHDHHCWVTAEGIDWRIRRVRGDVLYLGAPCPCGCGVDRISAEFMMNKATQDEYCRRAVEWDYALARSTMAPGSGRA